MSIIPGVLKFSSSFPKLVTVDTKFWAIFATHAGKIYGIGKNDYGQLGTGDNKGASTFVRCEELEK